MMKMDILRRGIDDWIWFGLLIFVASLIFSIAIVQIMVGALMFLWLTKMMITPGYRFVSTPLDYPLIAFVVIRIISVFTSVDFQTSLPALYKEIPFYVIYFIATNNLPAGDKAKIRKIMMLLIVTGCVAAVYGTAKVVLGVEERASSSTSGYSTLGMYLAVLISMALWMGRSQHFFRSRWFWGLSLLAMCCGLLFTLNRTHWGVAGLMIVIVGIMRERIALLCTAAIGGAALFFIPSMSNRFYQMVHFMQYSSGRDVIWTGALMRLMERPITGFGPRTFELVFPLRDRLEDKLIASWHNDFLQVYMESGVLALLAFIWMITSIYYQGFKITRTESIDPFYKELAIAIMLGMSAFFLTGLVGGFIIDPITSLLFRFLMAVVALMSAGSFGKKPAL